MMNSGYTLKLYDENAYETTFQAEVICAGEDIMPDGSRKNDECGRGTFTLILDRTLFFPEGGGQSPDKGEIEGFRVTDVQTEDGVIRHTVECRDGWQEVFAPGRTVTGRIDWNERFSNMQNHTGEHIISGILYKKYGYNNVGFHLSPQTVTLDTSGPLTDEQVRELERDVNRAVWENVKVTAEYPPEEELPGMFYRSKGEIDGPVRVVTIEGYDACACCAPHVRRTGEIGLILILKHEHYKGGTRFTFACGTRALQTVQRDRQIIRTLTDTLTTSPEELPVSVKSIIEESELRKQRGDCLMKKQAEMFIGAQAETDESIWIFDNDFDDPAKRFMINGLVKKTSKYAGIFAGGEKEGYNFIIGSAAADAREAAARLREALAARGGGSPKMVQGHVDAGKNEILKALEG